MTPSFKPHDPPVAPRSLCKHTRSAREAYREKRFHKPASGAAGGRRGPGGDGRGYVRLRSPRWDRAGANYQGAESPPNRPGANKVTPTGFTGVLARPIESTEWLAGGKMRTYFSKLPLSPRPDKRTTAPNLPQSAG